MTPIFSTCGPQRRSPSFSYAGTAKLEAFTVMRDTAPGPARKSPWMGAQSARATPANASTSSAS